jgi:hypothetical protein
MLGVIKTLKNSLCEQSSRLCNKTIRLILSQQRTWYRVVANPGIQMVANLVFRVVADPLRGLNLAAGVCLQINLMVLRTKHEKYIEYCKHIISLYTVYDEEYYTQEPCGETCCRCARCRVAYAASSVTTMVQYVFLSCHCSFELYSFTSSKKKE